MRPPLQALHVFETAARHLSYSLAAGELNVTHSAVSQQIRSLETTLGVPLFCRQGRQMLLTREGALLLKRIQPALRQLGEAVAEIGVLNRSPSITVTTLQSLANRWLLPRLAKFQQLQPEVAVHIQASADLKDLVRAEADIAIRYGRGTWKGCRAEKLMEEWLFPVCSPDYNQGRLPRTVNSLKRYRILTDDCHMEWNAWCKHAGMDFTEFIHGANYSDSNLMLGAAIAGQGIAIGRSALVSADIAAGRLVPVFELIAPAPFAYYLVTAEGRGQSPHLAAFGQWLHAEAAIFMQREVRSLGLAA